MLDPKYGLNTNIPLAQGFRGEGGLEPALPLRLSLDIGLGLDLDFDSQSTHLIIIINIFLNIINNYATI